MSLVVRFPVVDQDERDHEPRVLPPAAPGSIAATLAGGCCACERPLPAEIPPNPFASQHHPQTEPVSKTRFRPSDRSRLSRQFVVPVDWGLKRSSMFNVAATAASARPITDPGSAADVTSPTEETTTSPAIGITRRPAGRRKR